MQPTHQTSIDHTSAADWLEAERDLLARAKAISQQITERCEQLTGGTQVDHRPLPPEATEQQPST